MGLKECSERTPWATVVAAVLCILGFLFSFIGAASESSANDYFNDKIEKDSKSSVAVIAGTEVCKDIITLVVVIIALISAIIALSESRNDSNWKKNISSKYAFLVLLIIAFLCLLFWDGFTAYSFAYAIEENQSKRDCKNFRESKSSPICLETYDSVMGKTTTICEKDKIKYFCDNFVDLNETAFGFYYIGSATIYIGLSILLVALAVNYMRVHLESKVGETEGAGRRIV